MLLADRVELEDLGDGGRVAEETEEVDLALRARRGSVSKRHLHCRPHLTLDPGDELFDATRRRQNLLALNANEGRLGLAVRKDQVDGAADEQHASDQENDDHRVLAE